MNQRWRLLALWLLPLAVAAFLGWQLIGNGSLGLQGASGTGTPSRNTAVAQMTYEIGRAHV